MEDMCSFLKKEINLVRYARGFLIPYKIQLCFCAIRIQTSSGTDGTAYRIDRDGNPNVFNLNADDEQLKLNGNIAKPGNRWNADIRFVFLSRKYILFRILYGAVFLFGII